MSFAADTDTKEERKSRQERRIQQFEPLTRVAVSQEVIGESAVGYGSSTGQTSTEVLDKMGAIDERIQQVVGEHHEVNSRLKGVEQEVSRPSAEIQTLASEVFDVVPTARVGKCECGHQGWTFGGNSRVVD